MSQTRKQPDSHSELKKFESKHYYELLSDSSFFQETARHERARPTMLGAKLIADYYQNKYQCRISFPTPKYHSNYILGLPDFFKELAGNLIYLREMAKDSKEYREAFLVNFAQVHTIPIIYINKKGKEALLYANSLSVCSNQIEYFTNFYLKTGIPIYYITKPRQADQTSCRNDALVIGRDATAKKSGEYLIQDMLSFFEKQAASSTDGVHPLKDLPPHFLKTAQLSEFISAFKTADMKEKPIHKKETIMLFLDRYTLKGAKVIIQNKSAIKNVPTYLFTKGIKNCGIIKIQFYANQLSGLRQEFITAAKKLLKTNLQKSDNEQISLLHTLAINFKQKELTQEKGIWAKAFEWFNQTPDEDTCPKKSLTKEQLYWLRRNHF